MNQVINLRSTNVFGRAWASNQGLTVLAAFSIILIVFTSLGLVFDPRVTEFLGTPTWVKTFKFSVSTLLYSLGLIWILDLAKQRNATRLGGLVGWILSFELVLLVIQGARATPMHYNYSTPLNAALWISMTVGIMVMMVGFLVMCILVWRNLKAEPVLASGIRLGLAVTALGLAQGNLMPAPNAVQLKALEAGQTVALIGAHTVGSNSINPDSGTGLPLLGWSTTHGDLRIGHFVGIHALQVIPLFGLWLSRRRNLGSKKAIQLVWIGALAYLGLVALVTWQALRGQSIVQPDALTIGTFTAILGIALASSLFVSRKA